MAVPLAGDFRSLRSLPSRHMVRRSGTDTPTSAEGPGTFLEVSRRPGGNEGPDDRGWDAQGEPGPHEGTTGFSPGSAPKHVRLHVRVRHIGPPNHSEETGGTGTGDRASRFPQSPFTAPEQQGAPEAPSAPQKAAARDIKVPEPVLHVQLCIVAAVMCLLSMLISLTGGSVGLHVTTLLLGALSAATAAYAAQLEAQQPRSRGTAAGPVPRGFSDRSPWLVTLVKAEIVGGPVVGQAPFLSLSCSVPSVRLFCTTERGSCCKIDQLKSGKDRRILLKLGKPNIWVIK